MRLKHAVTLASLGILVGLIACSSEDNGSMGMPVLAAGSGGTVGMLGIRAWALLVAASCVTTGMHALLDALGVDFPRANIRFSRLV